MARRKASCPCVYQLSLLFPFSKVSLPSSKVNHHYNKDMDYAVGVEEVFEPFWARMCPLQQLQVSCICSALPPANLPAPNGSSGWGLWRCVQESLPTGHLLPGVDACVSSGIHYRDLGLLTQHPVSQTRFPHLLLDSSVFGGNSWAQKQHCKTIYIEDKMVLASSCPIFQLIEKTRSTHPVTGRRSSTDPGADGFGMRCPQQHSMQCLGVPGVALQGDCCCLALPGVTVGWVMWGVLGWPGRMWAAARGPRQEIGSCCWWSSRTVAPLSAGRSSAESTRASFWVTQHSGFWSEFSTVQDDNFCFWSLQDWGVAWETSTRGAGAKPSETFQSSLGMYCYMTPEPAPWEGSVHSWMLCRGSLPTPLCLCPLAVPLLGTTVLRGEKKAQIPPAGEGNPRKGCAWMSCMSSMHVMDVICMTRLCDASLICLHPCCV